MTEKIKNIAFQLFLKYGLRSVSMDDIAREAGISKKTLYQNIEDKKSLIKNVMQDFLEEDTACVLQIVDENTDAINQMIRINQVGLEIMKKIKPTLIYDLQKYYRDTWELVNKHHDDFFTKIIENNLKIGIKSGDYRKDLDVNIISRLFVSTMSNLVTNDKFHHSDYSKTQIVTQHLIYHLNGIINPQQYSRIQDISEQLLQTNK